MGSEMCIRDSSNSTDDDDATLPGAIGTVTLFVLQEMEDKKAKQAIKERGRGKKRCYHRKVEDFYDAGKMLS